MSATYEYGPRGDMPAVKLTWYQGEMQAGDLDRRRHSAMGQTACLFIGDKGMLLSDYGKHVLLPEKDFAGYQRPEPTIPRSPGHHAEWIDACKTGKPTSADFEYSGCAPYPSGFGF